MTAPTLEQLGALDAAVEKALKSGDESDFVVLGYGEISTVLALETPEGRFAVKRMPAFPDEAAVRAYTELLGDYIRTLERAGVHVVRSEVMRLPREAGGFAVYVVQPALDPATLLPKRLAGAEEGTAREIFTLVIDAVSRALEPGVGLDAQLSNWVDAGGELAYLDVSTPLLRDANGQERLDTDLFLSSLPWALRPLVKRFTLATILDKYYVLRGALLDIAGNFQKEGLEAHLPAFLELANRRVETAIDEREVRSYYADDARMWAVLQRLRRADRGWQRMLGRTYPFLLPGKIVRRA